MGEGPPNGPFQGPLDQPTPSKRPLKDQDEAGVMVVVLPAPLRPKNLRV